MLEKPDLPDAKISACLQDHYGLHIVSVEFLPLGADANTAVYRVVADDETPYFLKLRRSFNETSVLVPKFLSEQGIRQIIVPIETTTQQLWAALDDFAVILYPFVEGHNAFEVEMSARQWVEFGDALKRLHRALVPQTLVNRLKRETFSPQWREIVKEFQRRVEQETFDDPTAAKLAAFLKSKRDTVLFLVRQAERLASALQSQPREFVLCHSDVHAWNILIDSQASFYIVDWDDPILAPKERDLMFVGSGMGICDTTQQETLFYQGYSQTAIDHVALAYYRYERIVQDIAAYSEQILLTDEGGEDREQGLQNVIGNFLPNSIIDIARRSEKFLPSELRANLTSVRI